MLEKLHRYMTSLLQEYESLGFSSEQVISMAGQQEVTMQDLRGMVMALEGAMGKSPDSETQYLVKRIRACPECGGSGMVKNPLWALVREEHPASGIGSQEERRFWLEYGPYEDRPDEEEPCFECNGTGRVTDWVDLREALGGLLGDGTDG